MYSAGGVYHVWNIYVCCRLRRYMAVMEVNFIHRCKLIIEAQVHSQPTGVVLCIVSKCWSFCNSIIWAPCEPCVPCSVILWIVTHKPPVRPGYIASYCIGEQQDKSHTAFRVSEKLTATSIRDKIIMAVYVTETVLPKLIILILWLERSTSLLPTWRFPIVVMGTLVPISLIHWISDLSYFWFTSQLPGIIATFDWLVSY